MLFKKLKDRCLNSYKLIGAALHDPNNMLINWSDYNKGRLVLFFGILSQTIFTLWYLLSIFVFDYSAWLNLEYFQPLILMMASFLSVFIILFILSFYLKKHHYFKSFLAFFSPGFFGVTMILVGYNLGIYSPTTMAGFVSLVLLGLVLYRRIIMYSIVIPITAFVVITCYLTSIGKLRYAPIFSDALNNSVVYQNKFWLMTMLELFIPILMVTVILFEILLGQWRIREKQFETSSKYDALTNVYNRRQINEVLTKFHKNDEKYAVALLDIDHFKVINDQYGHDVGDLVLKEVAAVLSDHIRLEDPVGRYGGEEFILLFKNNNVEQALEVAERCRNAIEKHFFILPDGMRIQVTASFGVAIACEQNDQKNLTNLADQALYIAKAQGRNRVCQYA